MSYEFHSQRKLHPERFKNQLVNQVSSLLLLFSLSREGGMMGIKSTAGYVCKTWVHTGLVLRFTHAKIRQVRHGNFHVTTLSYLFLFISQLMNLFRNIHNLCKVKILKSGEWTDLSIPQRSIDCLNFLATDFPDICIRYQINAHIEYLIKTLSYGVWVYV